MKLDRREVTGLAAKPVIPPSDQSKTMAFKLFNALKSMEADLWDGVSHFTPPCTTLLCTCWDMKLAGRLRLLLTCTQ